MSEFGAAEEIRKQAGALADRVEFVPDATPAVLEQITLGVFFVMAFWSGPSRQAFSRLLEVITKHDPEGIIRIVVAYTDSIPEFHQSPDFRGKFHGWGETFWVRNGQVVADSGIGFNLELFEPNTIELLKLASPK